MAMKTLTQRDVFPYKLWCAYSWPHTLLISVAELTLTVYSGTFLKAPVIGGAPGILWALRTIQLDLTIDFKSTELQLKILCSSSGQLIKQSSPVNTVYLAEPHLAT